MLTNESRAEITMMTRVVNHLQNNQEIIRDNQEMMDALAVVKETVGAIWEQLEDVERDELLEQYQSEARYLGLSRKA